MLVFLKKRQSIRQGSFGFLIQSHRASHKRMVPNNSMQPTPAPQASLRSALRAAANGKRYVSK